MASTRTRRGARAASHAPLVASAGLALLLACAHAPGASGTTSSASSSNEAAAPASLPPGSPDPLREAISNEALPVPSRIDAIRAFRLREGVGAVKDLSPLLGSPHPEIREATAAALGTLGGDEARKQLQEQLEREENLAVRETLQKSLAKLEP